MDYRRDMGPVTKTKDNEFHSDIHCEGDGQNKEEEQVHVQEGCMGTTHVTDLLANTMDAESFDYAT